MHGATGDGGYHSGAVKTPVVRFWCVGWGALGRPQGQEPGGRANVPDVWAGLGGLSGQTAAQEARRNGAAARAKRYADCVLEDRCAKSDGKRNIF